MRIKTWHAVLFPTIVAFGLVAAEIPPETWATAAAFSLGCGVVALTLMAQAAVLGGRWRLVESWFAGLDRVYETHKWLGVFALAFASAHFAFKAGTDAWETASIIALPPGITRLARQLAFLALMLIVMLALNRKIRYSVWRWWHKLSGPLFLIVILHWLSFKSPIALTSPAGIWLAAFSTLGVISAGYKLLLYPVLSSHGEYCLVSVSPDKTAVRLQFLPVRHAIPFQPGQFGFLSLKEDGFREPHPFTIASGNEADGRVVFLIRASGDYTEKLVTHATVGMHADVYAPFGRFTRKVDAPREIWIAGGVGISPFIAWLRDQSANDFEKVTLFYFYTPGREFPGVEKIARLVHRQGAELVLVPGGPDSPEFSKRLGEIAHADDASAISVSFCGPSGLLKRVRRLIRANGIPEANLRYEKFEFR